MPFEPCQRVSCFMKGFTKPWGIAGGWAIDLFIGKECREHKDIEIAIFRKDQLYLKDFLSDWDFHKVINGEFQLWEDEFLQLPVHEIHATNRVDGDKIEILLNETKDEEWKFRRDIGISYPLASAWSYSPSEIPFLTPEIVLLYKVKNTREKDHHDFMTIREFLNDEKKLWLRKAIELHEPGHKWLEFL